MLSSVILATAFQILPFYEQKPAEDYYALRPLCSTEGETTDVLWPVFTKHRDWWRFCYIVNWQRYSETDDCYQFWILPFWFNGRDQEKGAYWGLFPVWGEHPHIGMMTDFKFALWPLWHQYKMPRGRDWMTSNAVLFPFFSWRSDGAWSIWPFYGVNYQRESDHRYALWPFVTWATYREDRDTAGEGSSWMVWPLYGQIRRSRERQDMFIPPFFSVAASWSRRKADDGIANSGPDSIRVRCPWPFVEYESTPLRRRISIWPIYERVANLSYKDGSETARVTRFGWKLVEIYDDETRVFPFWASRGDDTHFRIWPLWESERKGDVSHGRFLALFPIRWVPAVDRNWSKFWTFYENESCPLYTDHSLLWGIIRWRTLK